MCIRDSARDDLPPFVAGIQAGAGIVMSGHLDVKAIDPGVAATFSSKVLTDLLRGRLGFTGVVVTDAMNMAPAKKFSPGEAAVKAVVAGNDQHDDVGHVGAAGAHLGEGRMARRVDEGDLLAGRRRHLIGADMLGDAARLVRCLLYTSDAADEL